MRTFTLDADMSKWLRDFADALTSPVRDDGSLKSEPRQPIIDPVPAVSGNQEKSP